MKLVFFNDFKMGVLRDQEVVDVSSLISHIPSLQPQDTLRGVIENWSELKPVFERHSVEGPGIPLSSVRIRPPVPKPTNIDCMAANYVETHSEGQHDPMDAFHKSPNAITGHGDTMVLPDMPASSFEGEAELALVFGKRGFNIPVEEAYDYVFGYTCFIDGSARCYLPPHGYNFFYQVKCRETFAPIGPCIVTADEVPDPQNLAIKLWNNGILMQDFNTSEMVRSIKQCIAFISSVHTVEVGDILATGTDHRGLNPFMDGDHIELEIEAIGKLEIDVRDDLKRTWERVTRWQRWERASPEERTAHFFSDPNFFHLGLATPQLTGKHSEYVDFTNPHRRGADAPTK